ncbi:Flp pilus assembly protein CpaB [Sphingomonas lacunae]|uniref:Flp pilus assembly protein CpaB n=1 Tax=Sphingomonas lacunae TaxID=2698828 RepID=A0A6M4AY93_9SPHN|nr:Flp pilus assembly protein CpaB [Sphingomonas lacunae]QJQ33330.1 Flp pilus assembly protein CpaB [Sphingomonas lacunae]
MDVKKIMLIVGAMIVALGAAFGVNQLMRGSTGPEARAAATPKIEGPKVMVATRALPVGTILTADALRFQAWPEGLVKPDQYYVEGQAGIDALVGSVVRVPMTAGAPITKGALVNPGDRGFLAAALGPGMRAVTVPLSPDQGVAGFVFPGDRVDVLLTLQIEGEGGSGTSNNLATTETIVRNMRVLAVDQRTAPTDENGNSTPTVFGTVTLEATPQIAEKIAVARSVGTLSLALRSLAENASELEEAIASGQVSVARDGDSRGEARMLRGASSRPVDRGTTAVTGGDVSRYLRRSLPRSNPNTAAMAPSAPSAPAAAPSAAPSEPAAPVGPTVRVVRGDQVTVVPVGGR